MRFSATFAKVEALLAEVHDIASDKRTAFQARLKNFVRLGLVDQVKAGRGKAAHFSAEHLLMLELALEFAQMGVGPERTVKIIRANLDHIAAAVKASIATTREGFDENWSPTVIYFDPNGLSMLDNGGSESEVKLHFSDLETFKTRLRDMIVLDARLAVISITAVIVRVADAMQPKIKGVIELERFFVAALMTWADANG